MFVYQLEFGHWTWGELMPSKIFNPPFPVLKAVHSVSYSYIHVCWSGLMGGFLFIFFLFG